MQSLIVQVAPESERMEALTARMYAMVRKVAVPARSSVVKLLPLSASLKYLPTEEWFTALFNLPSRLCGLCSPLPCSTSIDGRLSPFVFSFSEKNRDKEDRKREREAGTDKVIKEEIPRGEV
jgi:hypothetical protein